MAQARGRKARRGLDRVWTGPAAGLGLLIVLGVIYFLVSRPAAPKTSPSLLHVTTDQIAALEFHAHGKALTLYANPGTAGAINWTIGAPGGTAADNSLVQGFVSNLVTLQPSRKLTSSPSTSDLQSYGLAPATAILIVQRKNGQPSIELDVGQTAPTGEYYARVGGDPAVYLIDGTVAAEISADPNAWLPLPSSSSPSTSASGSGASASGATGASSGASASAAGGAGSGTNASGAAGASASASSAK